VQQVCKTITKFNVAKDFSDMQVHKRLFHTLFINQKKTYLACIVG